MWWSFILVVLSRYWQGLTLLNFSDPTWTSVSTWSNRKRIFKLMTTINAEHIMQKYWRIHYEETFAIHWLNSHSNIDVEFLPNLCSKYCEPSKSWLLYYFLFNVHMLSILFVSLGECPNDVNFFFLFYLKLSRPCYCHRSSEEPHLCRIKCLIAASLHSYIGG